mmetsp:Transcript_29415/g.75040  ORF Transcript_29415/g.75040 Transcript_29415/m.75040 type:complete len:208 (-) Transcript_29415:1134-1757(-)
MRRATQPRAPTWRCLSLSATRRMARTARGSRRRCGTLWCTLTRWRPHAPAPSCTACWWTPLWRTLSALTQGSSCPGRPRCSRSITRAWRVHRSRMCSPFVQTLHQRQTRLQARARRWRAALSLSPMHHVCLASCPPLAQQPLQMGQQPAAVRSSSQQPRTRMARRQRPHSHTSLATSMRAGKSRLSGRSFTGGSLIYQRHGGMQGGA